MRSYRIALLPGDGIGPEVMEAAVHVLQAAAREYQFELSWLPALVGGAAIDACGKALPETTLEICQQSHAIFLGAVGGPKWESLPPEAQPERASLLPLRKFFGLYANLRPVTFYPELGPVSPLKEERLGKGTDILVVRELTGGLYFGEPKGIYPTGHGTERAVDTLVYETEEIERISRLAMKIAQARKRKLTVVDKANVLQSSLLWRKVLNRVAQEFPEVSLEFLYVDNAALQLVRDPRRFDVLLCENLFGDILSDELAGLAGSLGLLPSASLGSTRFGLYEPAGGSAPDIAGKGIANPLGQILSGALLFRYSLGEEEAARAIEKAVQKTLADGYRTADIATPGAHVVGTQEMAVAVAERIEPPN
ncbi:3-isopropylmalate dehydrogenase [Candidatus Methylacidithermus pantelleriae]|uniref:3-isopropylmalate dehydrogenase n=1 Tax=Candidatus Methylacidithermus pantelleriae TaxID=2744239 RepID=A0A8J2BRF2_9BACT|nr:3-isopropylmalate dehydrogenase [Candidatus Methylacidithermus pantelleriae]CAF0704543.1 3-isopropylmalate dehydrogenase [Candidatus Methylacidithermus pantelleriae]